MKKIDIPNFSSKMKEKTLRQLFFLEDKICCYFKGEANCSHVGPGLTGGAVSLCMWEDLFKGSQPLFKRISEKTTETLSS